MHCKIETKFPILDICLVPERKFSNLNFALYFFHFCFDLTELYKFQFFPQNFRRSPEIIFGDHNLKISCQ